jgi:putative ABC transport system ATP-binding protein
MIRLTRGAGVKRTIMTPANEPILAARGIHKTYGSGAARTEVLHGLDLAVRRGEFVCVMGPSGCGKSTLLHILGLIMPPTAADELTINGTAALRLSDGQRTRLRRETMGFVFQRFNLLPVLSAEQNVRLALRLRRTSADGQVMRILEAVDLGSERRKRPGQLSIGQQQRVAIARALVARPALLFADEPTGNLDSDNSRRILDLLRGFRDRDGQTIVMITHNEQCGGWADRVLHMKDGRIA